MTTGADWLQAYLDQEVVCDLHGNYLVYGTLVLADAQHLVLEQCDLHDHGEANSSKDVYNLETRQIGVRVNRDRVAVPRSVLIAISRLDEITP